MMAAAAANPLSIQKSACHGEPACRQAGSTNHHADFWKFFGLYLPEDSNPVFVLIYEWLRCISFGVGGGMIHNRVFT